MSDQDEGQLDSKSRRLIRVEKTLREIIGQSFLSMNSLFGGAMVTVVRVECNSDMRIAKVFVSIFGATDEDGIEDVFDALDEQRASIQHKIAKELPMKFCPKLNFVLDDSIDKLVHFSEVLNESKNHDFNPEEEDSSDND
jgi:ribosome-binding factor A